MPVIKRAAMLEAARSGRPTALLEAKESPDLFTTCSGWDGRRQKQQVH